MAETLVDFFNSDFFSQAVLTAAIENTAHVPGQIGASGIFSAEGISTTTAQIEQLSETLALVPTTPRGAPGTSVGNDKRKAFPVNVPHLQQDDTLLADSVQNVRKFGASAPETVQNMLMKRAEKMRRQIDMTWEWHRVGALKGVVYDSDGTTVLLNLFTLFGVSQPTQNVALSVSTTKLRNAFTTTQRTIEDALGGLPYTGLRAWCGNTFWDNLIEHDAVLKTYLNQAAANDLRGDPLLAFDFAGIRWERYRGKNGSTPYIADTKAYVVPAGVPELFISRFAPADYLDTVNGDGLPYYVRQYMLPNGKGINIEVQSNPLHMCTRPAAIVELTAT